ncbi:MAG TPA: hypothetical protein VKJ07_10800 [Mycobacteriales bacterium]|nr:hypothetical protein [Mycobacteriales bacterium]
MPAALRQITAVVAIGAIGATALAAAGSSSHGVMASAAASTVVAASTHREAEGRPVGAVHAAAPKHAAAVISKPAVRRPAAAPASAKAKSAQRWIPSGTGMWIYEWSKSNHGKASSVVAQARAVGLSHLFVRTGSTHDHYTGGTVLKELLPATAHTNIKVVAWDFPELKNPQKDAWRLAYAAYADYNNHNVPHVAAVAPDIETSAEGTHTSAKRVSIYLSALRRLLPSNVAILTTVPWPSSSRVGRYPYKAVAARSDALLPMAYWYDNSPTEVTATSISFLRRYKRPVQPVGQGYDGKLDVPSIPHNNLRKQMPMFFVTARKLGASAVSIWSWQAAPSVAWGYLSYAGKHGWYSADR